MILLRSFALVNRSNFTNCLLFKYTTHFNRQYLIFARNISIHSYRSAQNFYQVLGVKPNCSQKEIRLAYLELCKKYHPDKLSSGKAASKQQTVDNARFQQINEAYNCLSKENERSSYDLSLKGSRYSSNPNHQTTWQQQHTAAYAQYQRQYANSNRPPNYYQYFYDQDYYDHERMRREAYQRRKNNGFNDNKVFGNNFGRMFALSIAILVTIIQIRGHFLWASYNKNNQRQNYTDEERNKTRMKEQRKFYAKIDSI